MPTRVRARLGPRPRERPGNNGAADARLERGVVGFTGANAHGVLEHDEDLAVADLAGFRGRGDGSNSLLQLIGGDRDFDFQFRQKIHRVLGTTINLGVTLLPTVTLDLRIVIPCNPRSVKTCLTSSSLKGLIMAVTSFMVVLPL